MCMSSNAKKETTASKELSRKGHVVPSPTIQETLSFDSGGSGSSHGVFKLFTCQNIQGSNSRLGSRCQFIGQKAAARAHVKNVRASLQIHLINQPSSRLSKDDISFCYAFLSNGSGIKPSFSSYRSCNCDSLSCFMTCQGFDRSSVSPSN